MLIREKLQSLDNITKSERSVVQFILDNNNRLLDTSISEISKKTFVSAPTIVRLAQKMGYKGWRDMRLALYEENEYLKAHFDTVDPNLPFNRDDNVQIISSKIAQLLSDTILDTAKLIHHDDLQTALRCIEKATRIFIFAITNTAAAAYDFAAKMRYMGRDIRIIDNPEEFKFYLMMATCDDCFIFISYSGETFTQYNIINLIKALPSPSISITCLGENTLTSVTKAHLRISTKEKFFTQIANYVTNQSIYYILDVLYSCLFSQHYDRNIIKKEKISEQVDKNRRKKFEKE